MADLNSIDRLQPCLLDRLFDDEPRRTSESRQEKVVSLTRFKEGVKRDIEWLLNSKCRFDDLDGSLFGEVKRSVINFGVHDFTGLSSENLQAQTIERYIRDALVCYEPRIVPGTLSVRYVEPGEGVGELRRINALDFEISGKVWAEPLPQDFLLRTEMVIDNGTVSVV
jgi:type VI secretion system protein ImpF